MPLRNVLLAVVIIGFFTACHKNSTPPTPTPPPVDTTKTTPTLGMMNINLAYPTSFMPTAFYEVVISEPGGKVLLDTIAQYNTTVKAALKTNATLVDMTLVDTAGGTHGLTVYKSINPSTWVNVLPGDFATRYRGFLPGTSLGSLHITNYPSLGAGGTNVLTSFFLNNGPVLAEQAGSYNPATNILDETYSRYPGAYNYFSIPQLGLYKLYAPTRDKDTLDFTHMDTAITISYPRTTTPFTLSYLATIFLGITDSTNRSLDVSFMDSFLPHTIPNGDLQYARQPMQAYELEFNAYTPNNDGIGFYSYGKTIPTTAGFPDPSQFTISSTQVDNLSIKLNNPATTTYCETYWNVAGSSNTMVLYWPADSSTIRPQTFLTGLNAKFLSGVAFNSFKCHSFTMENIPGFNYSGYFTYTCDPAKVGTHQINAANYYTKYF